MITKIILATKIIDNKLIAVRTMEDGVLSLHSLKERILSFDEKYIIIIDNVEYSFLLNHNDLTLEVPDISILKKANQF